MHRWILIELNTHREHVSLQMWDKQADFVNKQNLALKNL